MTRLVPRIVFIAVLLASLPVAARDVRLQDANGEGGTCPDAAAAAAEDAQAGQPRAPAKRVAASPKAKASPAARGSDANTARAPRWHSFLPGMFR